MSWVISLHFYYVYLNYENLRNTIKKISIILKFYISEKYVNIAKYHHFRYINSLSFGFTNYLSIDYPFLKFLPRIILNLFRNTPKTSLILKALLPIS